MDKLNKLRNELEEQIKENEKIYLKLKKEGDYANALNYIDENIVLNSVILKIAKM